MQARGTRDFVDIVDWKHESDRRKNATKLTAVISGCDHDASMLLNAVRNTYRTGIGTDDKKDDFAISRVIFNDPATIVYWEDGTKTVVKCQDGDTYNAETGLLMCIAKRAYGNNGKFNDVLKAWVKPISQDPLTIEHVLDVLHEMYGRGR